MSEEREAERGRSSSSEVEVEYSCCTCVRVYKACFVRFVYTIRMYKAFLCEAHVKSGSLCSR